MVNLNGQQKAISNISIETNRGFLYGDAVFETIKVLDGKVLFLEDHYFRLMSSMRILRMEIPMNFTMEFFEKEIKKSISIENINSSTAYRVRFTVYRDSEGYYLPKEQSIGYVVTSERLLNEMYVFNEGTYEVELFRDFYITKHLLSTLKTTNKLVQVVGSIFAKENGFENCLVLNDEKNVIEALQSNLFVVKGNQIKTPPVSDGCVKGVMRKQIIELIANNKDYELVEESVSPFELQKADELFLTNCIVGVQAVSKYRKKEYTTNVTQELLKRLNAKIRLS
ncbi:aminotransferase class IV [Myroides guanonis]|uniref:branched-chain-amino-acid transaminase n=1 Tax=Myroides guanonis TaxID=1150112 RepID=A0A1I3UIG2_9FLAO|nr:aminotransferase class IV [Myroides guanonis]SFJ82712.1 branched-chain amino acid aminotransferase [Myroides guanonis]